MYPRTQIIGLILGVRKNKLIVFLGENIIGIIPKCFLKNKKFFIGQIIYGKTETCSSNLIRLKIITELKTPYFKTSEKTVTPSGQKMIRASKRSILKLFGSPKFNSFYERISKFLEFQNVFGINGIHCCSSSEKLYNNLFIIKSIYCFYMSL